MAKPESSEQALGPPERPSVFSRTRIRAGAVALRHRLSAWYAARTPTPAFPTASPAEAGFLANPLAWIKCLLGRLDANRAFGLGAEMAFWLFLSSLPLAAVAGVVAAKLAVGNWSIAARLLDSLPDATRALLTGELGRVAAWNGGQVGVGAGVTFLWLASSGVHSLFDGIEIEANAAPRPWWKKRLAALAACGALSAGIALLVLLATGLGWMWHLVGGSALLQALQFESSALGEVLRFGLSAAVSVGLLSGLYWIALPPTTRKAMPIVPGALLATLLQSAIGFGYGLYIRNVGDGGAYLAGLASIGVTLIALYLFCVVTLVGVEVNQMLGERRAARALHPSVD